MRDKLVGAFLIKSEDLLVRHRWRDARCAGGGCGSRRLQPLAGLCLFDIAGDDAAMRARAVDARDIDTGLLGETARERRGEDAGLAVGLWCGLLCRSGRR